MGTFPTKILVATDGSDEAGLAARTAADTAEKSGSELQVVHVRTLPFFLSYNAWRHDASGREDSRRASKQLEPRAQKLLDEQVDIAMPLRDVAQETGEPTLVAVGSRALRALQRTRVGSVSTKVVRAYTGPVLIYPRGARTGTDEPKDNGKRRDARLSVEDCEGETIAR